MSQDTTFEAVVAGGGMAGATLALALSQAGFRVAVVDAVAPETALAPDFDGRASAVAYANFRQWRALGVSAALEPVAQPLNAIVVSDGTQPGAASPARAPAFLTFDAAEIADRNDGEPLAWMIENRHIRVALAQAMAAAGIPVFAPAKVAGVETDVRGARIALADGRTLTASLVIGAEGRTSAVRRTAGLKTYGWDYPHAGVVATVALERPHEGVAHELFMGAGALAILPLTENRASLVWNEPRAAAAALMEAEPAVFEAHLARRFGGFLGGPPRLVGPRFSYPLGLMLAERMVAPRTALVGDAAHVIHPIAGQGLNLGLKDAAALAEVLADARRLGEDFGAEGVLERYARWRRFDVMGMAAATDLTLRLFAPANPLARAIRGLGMAALNRAAPLRRLFMQEAGGGLGDLPKLLRGEPLA
ncbi:MAG TPA: UbiH/UbiF/VisC/COQ6 family ubiquinone biosynthesis hydroxylase [Caulobacteraceae bacterium]|jgi:2-octaprenyl-6-methoxyphenol hydroxylase|nr:UbiH/UbiF/VisC/COQ6 family ubiquinone biosynthesis hydroxylase [Caulobacteraceae bacterium]